MHESKGQHIGKAPSLHLFHTAVRQCMGVFLKHTTSSLLYWQFMAVASFSGHFLAPPTLPGNEATSSPTLLLVASFPGHFLAPPTLPGNEEHDPASVSVQLGMFASYVATR